MTDKTANMKSALENAILTIDAIYQWLDRVEAAGGATSISGVAACNAMLNSMKKNRPRIIQSIIVPAKAALYDQQEPQK